MGVENIKIEAMKVYYGLDTKQSEKITIRAGVTKADLSGAYFHSYAKLAGQIVKHVFWFNTGGDAAHSLAFVGTPASGSLQLQFAGIGNVALDWDDSAGDLETKLQGLPGFDDVTVTGSFGAGFLITYVNYAGNPVLSLGANTLETSAPAAVVASFDVENLSSTPPVLPDATLHEVDIADPLIVTVQDIAAELTSVIDALTAVYSASVVNNVITVDHEVVGYAPSMHDAKDALKTTDFGFEILVQGDTEDELGCIDGDIEVAFEESFIDVQCHAEGITPVAQLKNGVSSVEVTMNLEETTKEKMKKMFVKSGGSFIPDNGSEVFGMGTFKNFENMFKYATKLRLHPARLLPGDRSEDYTFHKAIPNLTGLTFSGENVFTLPITFKVYPAEGIDSRVNYFSIGDGSQNLA